METQYGTFSRTSGGINPVSPLQRVSYETKKLRRRMQVNTSEEALFGTNILAGLQCCSEGNGLAHEGHTTPTNGSHNGSRSSNGSYSSSSSEECDLAMETLQTENFIFAKTLIRLKDCSLGTDRLSRKNVPPSPRKTPRYFMNEGYPEKDGEAVEMIFSTRPGFINHFWKDSCERFTIPPSKPGEILLSETPQYASRYPQLTNEEEFDAHMWFERWYPEVLREIAARGKYPAHDDPDDIDLEFEYHPIHCRKPLRRDSRGHIRLLDDYVCIPCPNPTTPALLHSVEHLNPEKTLGPLSTGQSDIELNTELTRRGNSLPPSFIYIDRLTDEVNAASSRSDSTISDPDHIDACSTYIDARFSEIENEPQATSHWSSSTNQSIPPTRPMISAKAAEILGESGENIYRSSSYQSLHDDQHRQTKPEITSNPSLADTVSRFSWDDDSVVGTKSRENTIGRISVDTNDNKNKMKGFLEKVVKGVKHGRTPPKPLVEEDTPDSRWLRRRGYIGE